MKYGTRILNISAILAWGLILMTAVAMPGCETLGLFGGPNNDPAVAKQTLVDRVGTLESTNQSAQNIISGLQERIAAYQEQIDDIPDDGQLAGQIRDAVERVSAELTKVQAIKDQTDEAIAQTQLAIDAIIADPAQGATGTTVGLDGIAAGVGSVGGVLPPPWNTAVAALSLGLAGIADFLRRKRRREDADELATQNARHEMILAHAESELETVVFGLDSAMKGDPELEKSIKNNGVALRTINGPQLDAKIRSMRINQ